MLTERQVDVLNFIDRRITETGVCPSYDELAGVAGQRSKAGVHRLVAGLEERGFIRRLPGQARSIEVIRNTDGTARPDTRIMKQMRVLKGALITIAKGRIDKGEPFPGDIAQSIATDALRKVETAS